MKPPPSRAYAHYVLGTLLVGYIFNFLDRNILSMLVEPIKAEFGVSDSMMGLLTGPVFVIAYTLAGVPIARLADRRSRVWIISIGLVVWSAFTALSGFTRRFAELAAARLGVGAGEATFVPSAHSLLSDYFPPGARATALSIFASGASIGAMLGYFGGGIIGETLGWREAFIYVGLPGVLFAVIFRATVREPVRGAFESEATREAPQPPLAEVLRELTRTRSFVYIVGAAMLHGFSSYGAAGWIPVFFMRVHEMTLMETGIALGIATGIASIAGQVGGGLLSDSLSQRDQRWYMWMPAITSIVALPLLITFVWMPTAFAALVFYVLGTFFANSWTGPTYAMGQSVARPQMRAMAAAIVIFMLNLVGAGLGPLVVGVLNDVFEPTYGAHAVRYSMMIIVVPHTLASICNMLAARTLREDLRRAAE